MLRSLQVPYHHMVVFWIAIVAYKSHASFTGDGHAPIGPLGLWGHFNTGLDLRHLTNSTRTLISSLKKICSNTRLSCSDLDPIDKGPSCCINCDCTEDCYATGRCCHDKTGSPRYTVGNLPATSKGEVCMKRYVLNSNGANLKTKSVSSIRSYLMVQLCDPMYKGEDTEKCIGPKIIQIDEMTPVYSKATNLHYSNIYCARCNLLNETELVNWDFVVMADRYHHGFANAFLLKKQVIPSDNSIITWLPPNPNLNMCFQDESMIASCSNHHMYNQNVHHACETLTMPFRIRDSIYRNAICFGCAENLTVIDSMTCRAFQSFGHGNSVPFLAIAKYRSALEKSETGHFSAQSDGKNGACLMDAAPEVECLTHACAPSMSRSNGTCSPLISRVQGISLGYRVFINYTTKPDGHPSKEEALYFLRGIVLALSPGDVCYESIKEIPTTNGSVAFHVTIMVGISALLDIHKIVHEFMLFLDEFNHPDIDVQTDNTPLQPLEHGQTGFVQFGAVSGQLCFQEIAMSRLQVCEGLLIPFHQCTITGDEMMQTQGIDFTASEYMVRLDTNGKPLYAQVCLDTFEARFSSTRSVYDMSLDKPLDLVSVSGMLTLSASVCAVALILALIVAFMRMKLKDQLGGEITNMS